MARNTDTSGAGRHRAHRRSRAQDEARTREARAPWGRTKDSADESWTPLPALGVLPRRQAACLDNVLTLTAPPALDVLGRLDAPSPASAEELLDPLADARRRGATVAAGALAGAITLPPLLGVSPAAAAVEHKSNPAPAVTQPARVEHFSPYLGPVSCDPTSKPGVVAFAQLVLSQWGHSGSYGTPQACNADAPSEDQEGRAWNLALDPDNFADQVIAQQVIDWLLADDATNARRLGIMYLTWDGRIWAAYEHGQGWQTYYGPDDATSGLRVAFSWAGAMKRTSWWTGVVAPTEYGPCQQYTGSLAPAYGKTVNLSPCPAPKPTYKVVRVESGQSLAAVARRNHTSAHRIVTLNHLKSHRISVGQRLRVGVVGAPLTRNSALLYSPRQNPRTAEDAVRWARSMAGDHGWHNLCLHFTARAYGWQHAGTRYAIDQWLSTPESLRHGGRNDVPPGALMFWDTGERAGHVALSLGNGYVASNDILTPGRISIVPASTIDEKWGARYLGWAAPYFPDGI